MCSLRLLIVLVVYNILTKWNMICRVNVHCSPEQGCCWQRDHHFHGHCQNNSRTKYYTNLYDHIPLTYMTILLGDNIIWCQEIFLLFWHGGLNYTIYYDQCKDSNAKKWINKQSMATVLHNTSLLKPFMSFMYTF